MVSPLTATVRHKSKGDMLSKNNKKACCCGDGYLKKAPFNSYMVIVIIIEQSPEFSLFNNMIQVCKTHKK